MATGDLMRLGATLLDDAKEAVRDSDKFGLHLDVALCLLEQERAGDPREDPLPYLARAIELARAEGALGPWLYGGAAHLGWLAARLGEQRNVAVANIGWIDDYVVSWAEQYPADLDIDLPQGILGLGLYGLAQPSPIIAEKINGAVVALIGERADRDPAGTFIRRSNPRRAELNDAYVLGHRDLGVAHGNMGLAAYLAMVARSGLGCADRAGELLAEVARWLLSVAVPDEDGSGVFRTTAEDTLRRPGILGGARPGR
jgi:hypothetical protein